MVMSRLQYGKAMCRFSGRFLNSHSVLSRSASKFQLNTSKRLISRLSDFQFTTDAEAEKEDRIETRNVNMKSISVPTTAEKVPQIEGVKFSSVCWSCGSRLQTDDENASGYYKPPKKEEVLSKLSKVKSKAIEQILARELADEGQILKKDEKIPLPKNEAVPKVKFKELQCLRCRDILHNNKYDPKTHEFISIEEVLEKVPRHQKIVYVISAREFPLGFSKKIFENRKLENIIFVINKLDAYLDSDKYRKMNNILSYFHGCLKNITGLPITRDQVYLASKKFSGLTSDLHRRLLDESTWYFVGPVNVGKSSLIRELLLKDDSSPERAKRFSQIISPFPAFTRESSSYERMNHKGYFIDTPGYNQEIFKYVLPKHFKNAIKIKERASKHHNLRKLRSIQVRGTEKRIFYEKNLYTPGGLFYIQAPNESIMKVFNGTTGNEYKYKNMEDLLKFNKRREPAMAHRWMVTPEAAENLVRYVIPPFIGNIDVIIEGMGFFSISPNGAFDPKKLYQIYAPKGVKVAVRDHIFPYLYDSKSPRVNKESGLKYEKSTKRIVGKSNSHYIPIFSSLIEVPLDATEEQVLKTVYPIEIPAADSGAIVDHKYWKTPSLK